MYCPYCGSENIEGAVYCQKCGKKLQEKANNPLKKVFLFLLIILLILGTLIIVGNMVRQAAIQETQAINATSTAKYLGGATWILINSK